MSGVTALHLPKVTGLHVLFTLPLVPPPGVPPSSAHPLPSSPARTFFLPLLPLRRTLLSPLLSGAHLPPSFPPFLSPLPSPQARTFFRLDPPRCLRLYDLWTSLGWVTAPAGPGNKQQQQGLTPLPSGGDSATADAAGGDAPLGGGQGVNDDAVFTWDPACMHAS